MARDADVVVFGEDVGYFGGVFRCTAGAAGRNTAEAAASTRRSAKAGIIGAAVGMARLRAAPGASKSSSPTTCIPAYRPDRLGSGAAALPLQRRVHLPRWWCACRTGGGIFGGQTHSQSPEALFTHVSGLKTVMPSNPYDAKGLLIAAIEDRRPGDLPGAEAALQRPLRRPSRPAGDALGRSTRAGRGAGGPLHRARSARRRSAAGGGGDGAGLRHHGACRRWRPRRKPASMPRSSTCAPWCRWISTRSAPRSQDRPLRHRPRGDAHLGLRRRTVGAGAGTLLLPPGGADPAGRPAGTRPIRTRRNGTISPARRASAARCARRWRTEPWADTSFRLPDIGEGVAEAEIVELARQGRRHGARGDTAADVMTDKATVEIPSPVAGEIVWLAADVGNVMAVGCELVRVKVSGGRTPEAPTPKQPARRATAGIAPARVTPASRRRASPPRLTSPAPPGPRRFAAPAGRRGPGARGRLPRPRSRLRAREAGIDLRQVPGSGPAGRITHEDLDAFFAWNCTPRRRRRAAPPTAV